MGLFIYVTGVKYWNIAIVLGAGGCWDDKGGCEHTCTNLQNRQYTCSCRLGYRLKGDQKTCEGSISFHGIADRIAETN